MITAIHHRVSRARTNLGKLRDALANEGDETQRMWDIWQRSWKRQATREEILWARTQFLDVVRGTGMSILWVVPLPGFTIVIGAVHVIGRVFKIELYPSSIRNIDWKA